MATDLRYPAVARAALDHIEATQLDNIHAAARIVVDAFSTGGILQAYGTGHSRIVTLELAGRAGGLANVGMLAVKDLVMFGGAAPKEILDPTHERDSGLARRIYDLALPQPQDVFLIVSNSGINGSVVEMARLARAREHPIIAITSVRHTASVPSRDQHGGRLIDLADIVIDNNAPPGDAAIQLRPGMAIGAISSLTGVYIAQLLTERICRLMLTDKVDPPIHLSANLPNGDAHNAALYERYRKRVRTIEP
jgi:uncharacterized phosphosugar-binding protein